MNRTETAALLTLISAYDRRTLGDADVIAWQDALDDLRYVDAEAVVKKHYRNSRDWLMPSDVRAGVRRHREDRLSRYPGANGTLPREIRDAMVDGTIEPPSLRPRQMPALEGVFRRVPDA